MTPEETREAAEVMRRSAAGEPVQCKIRDSPKARWIDDSDPTWDWDEWMFRIKPPKKTGYINVYGGPSAGQWWSIAPSREAADTRRSPSRDRIACVRIEYEEGQFDD